MRGTGALLAWVVAAWPVAAPAQEGPSFDCRSADTATERTICGSARLSRLERRMVRSYDGMVERIGPTEARTLADRLLERRQACGGEPACIEERLIAARRRFDAMGTEAGPGGEAPDREAEARAAVMRFVLGEVPRPPSRPAGLVVAAAPALSGAAAGLDPTPPLPPARPEDFAAAAPVPLDGAAPPPAEVAAVPAGARPLDPLPTAPEAAPAPDALPSGEAPVAAAAPGADPTPGGEGGSGPALQSAFDALPAERRVALQGRLVTAGYGGGAATGAWDLSTAAALSSLLLDLGGDGVAFDPTTPAGATALLDFIASDGFARLYLGGAAAP